MLFLVLYSYISLFLMQYWVKNSMVLYLKSFDQFYMLEIEVRLFYIILNNISYSKAWKKNYLNWFLSNGDILSRETSFNEKLKKETIERKSRMSICFIAIQRYVVKYIGYGLLLRKRRYKNVLSTEQENRLALISIRLFEIEMN